MRIMRERRRRRRLLGSIHGRATQGGNGGHLEDNPDAGGDRGGLRTRSPRDEPRVRLRAQRGRRAGDEDDRRQPRRQRMDRAGASLLQHRPSATPATARGSRWGRRPHRPSATPATAPRHRRLRSSRSSPRTGQRASRRGRSSPSRAAQPYCWRLARERCSSRRATAEWRCRSADHQRGSCEGGASRPLGVLAELGCVVTERRRSRTDRAVGYTTAQVLKTCWATGPMPLHESG